MIQIMLLIVFLTVVACTPHTDYCDRSLCGGHRHIACRNSGLFAPTCRKPNHVAMTPKFKKIILWKHNSYRNLIALGKQRHFSPAAKMMKMEWNNELARFAELNVLQCRMKHDQCRNTNEYRWCGQNLGVRQSRTRININSTVNSLIKEWYQEHTKATMTDINKFRRSKLRSIGHFTGMIQENATEVGCAIAKYKSSTWHNLLFACNYSFMNVNGKPVYEVGKNCSKCSTGCDRVYKALCSSKEKVISTP